MGKKSLMILLVLIFVLTVGSMVYAQPWVGPGGGFLPFLPEILDIELEEFWTARREGLSLKEIVEAQGLTVEEAQERLLAAHGEWLDELVAAGRLTSKEAAWRQERMAQRIEALFEENSENSLRRGRSWRPFQGEGFPRRGPGRRLWLEEGDDEPRPRGPRFRPRCPWCCW
ncbi:MAG: hypothetical protein ACOYD6_05795 [Limnochordia bacterium]|jgi:hypothetical protein